MKERLVLDCNERQVVELSAMYNVYADIYNKSLEYIERNPDLVNILCQFNQTADRVKHMNWYHILCGYSRYHDEKLFNSAFYAAYCMCMVHKKDDGYGDKCNLIIAPLKHMGSGESGTMYLQLGSVKTNGYEIEIDCIHGPIKLADNKVIDLPIGSDSIKIQITNDGECFIELEYDAYITDNTHCEYCGAIATGIDEHGCACCDSCFDLNIMEGCRLCIVYR